MKTIKLVIPFYNAEKYLVNCINSVLSQNYNNYHIIVINDCSTDNSSNIMSDFVNSSNKITYIENKERMYPMYNHQNAIFNYCDKDDIVVHLDGDDYLIDNNVLKFIDHFYETSKCLMMYGQAVYIDGRIGNARPYNSKQEFEYKRNLPFYVSHIRTFMAKGFYEIKNQDPELLSFKDKNKQWYKMSADVAMMYPLMEIFGYEYVKYNDVPLYVYNNLNPICEYKLNLNLQESIHYEILKKPCFNRKNFNENS